MTVWPFKQRGDVIESLAWLTDVFQAKAGEQRTALRAAPRRVFELSHLFTDYDYSTARALIRQDQGEDGFAVPDWPQASVVGAVASGTSVAITLDTTYINFGPTALLWEHSGLYEEIDITVTLTDVTAATVVNDYTDARLIPLWGAYCPNGLSNSRGAGQINQASVQMRVYENQDLAASTYDQYRGHDVLPSCPVVGGGSFDESIVWPLSEFDNQTSVPEYIRSRTIPELEFTMRWHEFTAQGLFELRQWLHSRRGRQKVFWFSSRGHDLEPAANIAGTTATVFRQGVMRPESYDIDVTTKAGVSTYHQVTAVANGTDVSGRLTTDLTITPALTLTLANISRISYLRCTRFDADRVELQHSPSGGTQVQMPCIEVPLP